jgi:hypothetical protein
MEIPKPVLQTGIDKDVQANFDAQSKYDADIMAADPNDLSGEDLDRRIELEVKETEAHLSQRTFKDKAIEGGLSTLAPAGALAGGVVGASGGPGTSVAAASIGWAAGKELERKIREHALNDESAKTKLSDIPVDLVTGAAQEFGGQIISKGLNLAAPYAKQAMRDNAPEIIKAAESLGVKPTRGMIEKGPIVQKEIDISSSPSFAGDKFRTKITSVVDELSNAADDILKGESQASDIMARDAYENTLKKQGIPGDLTEKYAKEFENFSPGFKAKAAMGAETKTLQEVYEKAYGEIDSHLQYVPIKESQKISLIKKIKSSVFRKSDPAYAKANQIAEDIAGKINNAKDLKSLLSDVRKIARTKESSDVGASYSINSIADEIEKKLHDSILRESLETTAALERKLNLSNQTPDQTDMIYGLSDDLKSLNKRYAEDINNISAISENAGIGKQPSLGAFIKDLRNTPDDQLVEKIFNNKNSLALIKMIKSAPASFEVVRSAYLKHLKDMSTVNGAIDPIKLSSQLNRVSDTGLKLIFGGSTDKFKAIQLISKNIPKGYEKVVDARITRDTVSNLLNQVPDVAATFMYNRPGLAGGLAKMQGNPTRGLVAGAGMGLNNLLSPKIPNAFDRSKAHGFVMMDTASAYDEAMSYGLPIDQYMQQKEMEIKQDRNISNTDKARHLNLLRDNKRVVIPK